MGAKVAARSKGDTWRRSLNSTVQPRFLCKPWEDEHNWFLPGTMRSNVTYTRQHLRKNIQPKSFIYQGDSRSNVLGSKGRRKHIKLEDKDKGIALADDDAKRFTGRRAQRTVITRHSTCSRLNSSCRYLLRMAAIWLVNQEVKIISPMICLMQESVSAYFSWQHPPWAHRMLGKLDPSASKPECRDGEHWDEDPRHCLQMSYYIRLEKLQPSSFNHPKAIDSVLIRVGPAKNSICH